MKLNIIYICALCTLVILTSCSPLCNTMEGNEKDNCYLEAAQAGNSMACSFIENIVFKEACIAEIAIKDKDLHACEDIADTKTRNSCLAQVAGLTGNKDVCTSIETEQWQNVCYKNVALTLGENDLCEEIQDEEMRNECLEDIAIKSNNPEACINLSEGQNECLLSVAKAFNNPVACSLYDTQREGGSVNKDLCYKTLVRMQGSEELCDNIVDSKIRKECLDLS